MQLVTDHPSCTLAYALDYRNEDVVHKFLERFEMSFTEAEDLFRETLKWLWLCSQPGGSKMMITEELLLLDEMWHTFILVTADYSEYCQTRFGPYLHHAPTTQSEKDKIQQKVRNNPVAFRAEQRRHRRGLFTFVNEQLGADTLKKWFVDYPRRYGADFFAQCVKPIRPNARPDLMAALEQIADAYRSEKSYAVSEGNPENVPA